MSELEEELEDELESEEDGLVLVCEEVWDDGLVEVFEEDEDELEELELEEVSEEGVDDLGGVYVGVELYVEEVSGVDEYVGVEEYELVLGVGYELTLGDTFELGLGITVDDCSDVRSTGSTRTWTELLIPFSLEI